MISAQILLSRSYYRPMAIARQYPVFLFSFGMMFVAMATLWETGSFNWNCTRQGPQRHHYGHWSRWYWSSRHARLNISIRHRRPSDPSRRPSPALRCQRSSTRLVSFLPVQSLIYSSSEFWCVGDGCCLLRRSTRLIVGPKDVHCIHRRNRLNGVFAQHDVSHHCFISYHIIIS